MIRPNLLWKFAALLLLAASNACVAGQKTDELVPPTPGRGATIAAEASAIWPPFSELARFQREAGAGGRREMLDPRQVAQIYLQRRLGTRTEAGRKGDFGLGHVEQPLGKRHAQMTFGDVHDLPYGGVELWRYKPNGIWFVIRAGNPIVGPDEDTSEFGGGRLIEHIYFRGEGSGEMLVQVEGKDQPLLKETFKTRPGKTGHTIKIDRNVSGDRVHFLAFLRTRDKTAFQEWIQATESWKPTKRFP